MYFRLLGQLKQIETIAAGTRIRELRRLNRAYGRARWRKRKGIGRIELPDGTIVIAELPWYEAHGLGRKELKIKRLLEEDES